MLFVTRFFGAWISAGIFLVAASGAHAQSSTNHQTEFRGEVLSYKWRGLSFKYPHGWHVEPQYYRTPAEEAAGKPEYVLGFEVVPNLETSSSKDRVYLGGRQAECDSFPHCTCFTIYEAIHTCSDNPETLKVLGLILETVRVDDPNAAFRIRFPKARDTVKSGKRCTIRWRTEPSLSISRVDIAVRDTSTTWDKGTILDAKNVPNTGSYQWLVPEKVDSPGPYILEISFLKPIRVKPPALGGGRIYSGRSEPFYIH